MIGIIFSGFLYSNGEGFRQGTIFYIVIGILLTSAIIMWITSRKQKERNSRIAREETINEDTQKLCFARNNAKIYKWFLITLIITVIGSTCTSQVFLLFLKLPEGINATDHEMSLILTAWTLAGIVTSISCGWLSDRLGRIKVLFVGFILAIVTPIFYGFALNVFLMTLIYGLNGVSFWILQTVGFALAGDMIPEDKRGRLFSKYNTVMALGWGPAGLLVGGPLADFQTKNLYVPPYKAYLNTFYASSIIVLVGTILFYIKVATAIKPCVNN